MYGLSPSLPLPIFYLAVASERGLEKVCEFAIAVGYVELLFRQGRYHITQAAQALVDGLYCVCVCVCV